MKNPNNINEVGTRLGQIWDKQKGMLETIKADGRVFNKEEKAEYDKHEAEYLELDEHKRTLEGAKKRESDLSEFRHEKAEKQGLSKDELTSRNRKVFEHYLKFGMQQMDQAARGLMASNYESHGSEKPVLYLDESGQAQNLSFGDAMQRGTSTQIAGTTTLGGYTVPEDWSGEIDMAMQAIGAVDDVCKVHNSKKGGTLPWPKVDDTGVTGAIMTEGAAPVVSDLTFGITNLADYTYTSYWIKLSLQLLEDEDVDLVSLVGVAIAERLRRGMNTHWTTGDGSSKPTGVVNAASEGVDGGDSAALSASVMYDLKDSVDPKYAANGSWMFNNTTLTAIKKLSVGSSDNRPLWVPSLRDNAPATIDGDPYTINQQMASPAAAAKYMLYGDFKGFLVRKIGGMRIIRTDERFIDALSVGFLGYQRTDSALISAGAPIKYLYRAAT